MSSLDATDPAAEACSIHRAHSPAHLTVEFHHVVPVAWQLKTAVAVMPYPGQDPNGRGLLWDDRGVWLCPTGHRNVHHWIVALMHAAVAAGSDDPIVAEKAIRPRRSVEFPVAVEALANYRAESGASLLTLASVGEWGQV